MAEDKRDEFDEIAEDESFELDDLDEAEEAQHQRLNADLLLDKVIPDEIDWRDMVRRHPVVTVGAAAMVGFLLGRSKGAAIVAGLSAGLTTAVMRQLSDVFEGEVFEF
jgi:hypothetical protein